MTKDNLKNAERDLHILFRSLRLTLPLPVRSLRFGLLHIHHLRIGDWFDYLMTEHPDFVLGGFTPDGCHHQLLLRTFWRNLEHSMADHWVFQNRDNCLEQCVPFLLHLDEGTSLRKTGILVYNMQPIFGRSTASKFAARFSAEPGRSDDDLFRYMTESQCHNQKGVTYKSRFLYTAVPKKWYTKKNAAIYDKILNRLAEECIDLMTTGLEIQGRVWFFICIGVKGDAPALAKAGHFTRSFAILVLFEQRFNFLLSCVVLRWLS